MATGYWARREDVSVGPLALAGILSIPDKARGVVVFPHASANKRCRSNIRVATALHARGFATLAFDLLSAAEARDRHNLVDVDLLGSRVLDAVLWVSRDPRTEQFPIGLLGASTAAGAALVAAAQAPERVSVLVSCGGRPDLAGAELSHVRAPTLLVVGGADHAMMEHNTDAFLKLTCLKRLDVVPGGTHLFEGEGALKSVIDAAAHWFDLYLLSKSSIQASAAGKRRFQA